MSLDPLNNTQRVCAQVHDVRVDLLVGSGHDGFAGVALAVVALVLIPSIEL